MAWQILLSRGAPPKLVALIRDLHIHHSAVIRSEVDFAPTVCCFDDKMLFEALGGHVITLYVRELLKANSKCAAAQLVFMHLMCVGCPAVPVQPANKSW